MKEEKDESNDKAGGSFLHLRRSKWGCRRAAVVKVPKISLYT